MKTAPKHASAGAVHRKGSRCLDTITLRQIFSPRKQPDLLSGGTGADLNVPSSTAGTLRPPSNWMPACCLKTPCGRDT